MKEDFQIVRLAEGDVRCKTDHLANFEDLILANERMYPEIERWYKNKVLPGIMRWTPKTGPLVKMDFCWSAGEEKADYESKTQTA